MTSVRDHISIGALHRSQHQPAQFVRKGLGSAVAGAARQFAAGWKLGSYPKPGAAKMQTPVSVTGSTSAPGTTTTAKVNARPATAGAYTCPKHGNYATTGEHRVDNPTCRYGPKVKGGAHVPGSAMPMPTGAIVGNPPAKPAPAAQTPVAVAKPAPAKTVVKVGKPRTQLGIAMAAGHYPGDEETAGKVNKGDAMRKWAAKKAAKGGP